MKSGLSVSPKIAHTGHYQRKQRRQKRLQIVSDEKILLLRFAHNGGWIDRIATMKDSIAIEDGVLMLQRVIAVMITERTFKPAFMGRRAADQWLPTARPNFTSSRFSGSDR